MKPRPFDNVESFESKGAADDPKSVRAVCLSLPDRDRIALRGGGYGRRVSHQGRLQYTRMGFGTKVPVEERMAEITILDRFGNTAVVKAVARDWVDYLQIGKVNGEWKIINVLWEMKPRPEN
ncbi:MAG: nuclear transport factor 2 family protein [Acidobacteriota bacterium]